MAGLISVKVHDFVFFNCAYITGMFLYIGCASTNAAYKNTPIVNDFSVYPISLQCKFLYSTTPKDVCKYFSSCTVMNNKYL